MLHDKYKWFMLLKYLMTVLVVFSLNNISWLTDALFLIMNYIHPLSPLSNFSPNLTLFYVEIRALEIKCTTEMISGSLHKHLGKENHTYL